MFSKIIMVISTTLFVLALIFGLRYMDSVSGATAMTVTGSAFLTTAVWYYKKSQSENVARIRIDHAKQIADIEYENFEKRARLMKELHLTEGDAFKIDNGTVMDEMENEAVAEDTSYLRDQFDNNASDPDVEAVG